jgi:anti-sigma B factor antagonist
MDLVCRHTQVAERAVLQVSGEIDLATLPAFRDHLTRLIDANVGGTVHVDLDGVTVLDDTGLGMLLGAAGRARRHGGDLCVVCTTPSLLERFELTGLSRAVDITSGASGATSTTAD